MARSDVTVFNTMLLWDVVRGEDSTGVAAVNRSESNRKWEILKQAWPAYYFQEHKNYDKVVSVGNSVLLGHNRKATMGKVNANNAHPFEFENIVGAHNGTIPDNERREIPDYRDFETDSEAIFHAIDVLGAAEFIPTLKGAYALTWYDKRDHTINFLRNNERDFTYCVSESGETLYWASEPWMVHGALGRNGIKYDKVWRTNPDIWYKFKIPDKFSDKFDKPEEMKLEGRKESKVYSVARFQNGQYQGGHPYGSYGYGDDCDDLFPQNRPRVVGPSSPLGELGRKAGSLKEAEKKTPEEAWARVQPVTINKGRANERIENRIVGVNGEELSEKVFRNVTKETCACCDEIVNFEAVVNGTDKIKFVNRSQFVCETCADDPWGERWYIENQLLNGTKH